MQAARRVARGAILAGAAALSMTLAGCGSDREPKLMFLRSTTNGPDEFGILPPKALQMPENLKDLPAPTPGGTNITDPTPEADAVTALGGRPDAGGSDAALVGYATRNGVAQNIRGQLAAEDLDHRRRNDARLFERLFGSNAYYRAYKGMSLDQHSELAYWRRRGVGNPSAPPRQDGER